VRYWIVLILSLFLTAGHAGQPPAPTQVLQYRGWIEEMKSAARGPFSRIRWFCKDGSVLPPEPFACRDRGGGSQHGEWSEKTLELRRAGYLIANFYSDLDIDALLSDQWHHDSLAQMLIEQFLVHADDGWILRRARFYRGAFQEEGERAGARRLLLRLAEQKPWLTTRFLQLRTAAALLPHGRDTTTARDVRQRASTLVAMDPGFVPLRNKIHGLPSARDADAVRDYADGLDDQALVLELLELAEAIDELHGAAAGPALDELREKIESIDPGFANRLGRLRPLLEPDRPAGERFTASASVLAGLRDVVTAANGSGLRLQVLNAGILTESENFAAAAELREQIPALNRRRRLELLHDCIGALYGVGLISRRQSHALQASLDTVSGADPALAEYRRELQYLALAPYWGSQTLRFFFGPAAEKLAEIEPLSHRFTQEHLRSSPLYLYGHLIDSLVRDGNRLAGVRNELFGFEAGAGLRALNPGLARGTLQDGRGVPPHEFRRGGIYLLPETEAELPPVAGILTAGEGNPLSHVQLLARNLGIPNVALDESLFDRLLPFIGSDVVLAVSSGGTVLLTADQQHLDTAMAGVETSPRPLIEPDLAKLDLQFRELVALRSLRAADSGRIVGPKAARLGELKRHFPGAVPAGLAIPFGTFRRLLEQTGPDGTLSMYEWMVESYRRLEALPPGSPERRQRTEQFRRMVHDWIAAADPGEPLRTELRARMQQEFGMDGSYGVFVRSDTNVEDLPGFTGAGLNLTVANVVGFENVVQAVSLVWASPFAQRAFAWRQPLMLHPEHVYPAVLLQLSSNVDKSGVMVTLDMDSGDPDWLSVAVNEGVGGAVDGQSAESLRIHVPGGNVRLMAQASAPVRPQLSARGGIVMLPASGADQVLKDDEIRQLIRLAQQILERFPATLDASGRPLPKDIEFGFADGELRLFQIRPLADDTRTRDNDFLRGMDPETDALRGVRVALDAMPE
jgi:hypothetical protein